MATTSNEYSYIRGNGGYDVPFLTIPEMIKRHAEQTRNAVAQMYINWETLEKECLTFTTIYDSGTKFAKGLKALGVSKGDIIAIGTSNCSEWIIAHVGALLCGAVSLFFAFNKKDGSDVESLLARVGDNCKAVVFPPGQNNENITIAKKLFTKDEVKGKYTSTVVQNLEGLILMSAVSSREFLNMQDVYEIGISTNGFPHVDPEDQAAIFMTSGTMGQPKMIPHTHYSLLMSGLYVVDTICDAIGPLFNDRPFQWQAGYSYWEFATGGQRVLIKSVNDIPTIQTYNAVVGRIFSEIRINSAFLVSSMVADILQRGDPDDWKQRSIVIAGQPVPRALSRKASEACKRLTIAYGISETSLISYLVVNKDEIYQDYEVGFPAPGVEVKVVDNEGKLLKRGERGEVCVRSPLMFREYYGDNEKTANAITKSRWFKTDDSGIMKQNGTLIVEGRQSDSLIKTITEFQSVASMEGQLKQHPGVADAVVVTFKNEQGFQQVCCAVIRKVGVELTIRELQDYLMDPQNQTSDLWRKINVSKNFLFFESFPRTYNGKTSRKDVLNACRNRLHEM